MDKIEINQEFLLLHLATKSNEVQNYFCKQPIKNLLFSQFFSLQNHEMRRIYENSAIK